MGETSPWLKCILITLSIILFLFSLLMVTLFVLSWSSYKSHFQHQDEEMANQTITSDKPMVEDMVEIEQQMTIALIIFTSLLIISTILFLAVYLENLCLLYVSLTVSIIGFFILLIVMGIDLVLDRYNTKLIISYSIPLLMMGGFVYCIYKLIKQIKA